MATNSSASPSDGSGEGSGEGGGIPSIVVNQVIYLSVVAVIGVFANLTVLVKGIAYHRRTTNRNRVAMTTTNFLVINLAISDLGTSTFSVASFILPSYVPTFPINEFTCKYIQPFRELFFAVSIFSVAFIGTYRYLILFETFQKRMTFLSSNIINNIIIWIMCYLILALPFSAVFKVDFVDGARICDPAYDTPTAQRAHRTFIVVVNAFLPVIMVSLSYIGIIRRLRRLRMVVTPVEVGNKQIRNAEMPMGLIVQSHRIVKVSILLLIAYWVTVLPYAFLIIAVEYGYLDEIDIPEIEQLGAIAVCLLYSPVVLNPLILMFTSDLYRPKLTTIWYLFACWVTVPQRARIKTRTNIKVIHG